jgi:hypothetical protein
MINKEKNEDIEFDKEILLTLAQAKEYSSLKKAALNLLVK